jgi:DnaJ family protein C protein 17
MSSSSKKGQPSIDPYDVLELQPGASDAEITKAYRKLALKLHPDKQKSGLSEKEAEAIGKQFHDIKDARSFLLDSEHVGDRRKFDAKRESERLRKQADALREQTMSTRRKRMRDELKEKEAQARRTKSKKSKQAMHDQEVDQLRRDGQQMREAHAERDAQKEVERELKMERQNNKDDLEERQVRLKWDRKKLSISPSEDSLASLLSQFGQVEQVELLGSKGNQALVTFSDDSSCRLCVDAYATSKEMRAKFVGRRKEKEEEKEGEVHLPATSSERVSRGAEEETLEERRLRQAAEREALLRRMELEENNGAAVGSDKFEIKPARKPEKALLMPFPIPFPDSEELRDLTPLQKLETFEQTILGVLLSSEQLKSIQVTR